MNKFKYVKDGCNPKDALTLDQIFGQKRVPILPYKNAVELEAALKGMNLSDMQSLAVNLGIKATWDRARLTRSCKDQFDRLTKSYGGAQNTEEIESKPFDPSKF